VVIVGIDVAGSKRGFHLANMIPGSGKIRGLKHCQTVGDVLWLLNSLKSPMLVAIDCPPRCQLLEAKTRLSERQLHEKGYRVQWTRRQNLAPQEWMRNGQDLWEALATLPNAQLIETFPTVATSSLVNSQVELPLRLLAAYADRREWKDFVDAAICTEVGDRFLRGEAKSVGRDEATDETDELGPIWF
jgi:predicted nuclease with RNAse H fold